MNKQWLKAAGIRAVKTIAQTAYDWLDGKEVESFIPIETFLITSENVDEYGTDGWQ